MYANKKEGNKSIHDCVQLKAVLEHRLKSDQYSDPIVVGVKEETDLGTVRLSIPCVPSMTENELISLTTDILTQDGYEILETWNKVTFFNNVHFFRVMKKQERKSVPSLVLPSITEPVPIRTKRTPRSNVRSAVVPRTDIDFKNLSKHLVWVVALLFIVYLLY